MLDTLNRRDFMKIGAGALAAALPTTSSLAAEPPAKKRSIRKAMMYAKLSYKGSVLEKFQALKAAGFEGVEPMSHMDQEEVLKALDMTGLKPASVCCSTHWSKRLSDPSDTVRREAREGVQRALQDAKRYGATSVLVVPGVVNKDVSYDDCFKRSVAEVRQLVKVAEETGVKIAIENVWNNFITKPEQLIEYVDSFKSPTVGAYFDCSNMIKYGVPSAEWVRKLGKRMLKFDFKGYSKTRGWVPIGEGDEDWPEILKACAEVGYHTWATAEVAGGGTKELKDVAERMNRILGLT